MNTPSTRFVAASMASLLLLAACGSSSATSTWTIAPVQPTPSGGPASPAASPVQSGMPMPSAGASGAPASGAPASGAPASGAPASPGASAAASAAVTTVILDLTGSLSITDENGAPVATIDAKVGETLHFVVDNTAGFAHNFFIGPADALAQNQIGDLPGIPDWASGVQEFDYLVTADTANLQFGCTVPGHYALMHGTFNVTP